MLCIPDYHRVTEVWVRNWCVKHVCPYGKITCSSQSVTNVFCTYRRWNDKSLAWFRRLSCPANTANTLCTVPINGGLNAPNETAWCQHYYNATNCTDIRDAAQEYATTRILLIYYLNAIWGVLFIALVSPPLSVTS